MTEEPTRLVNVRDVFGFDSDMQVEAFTTRTAHVPEIDPDYRFQPEVTLAILLGFECNWRVLLHGLHGTGKSSHIEQVAARLNWPCIRVNLDGQLGRLDLIGRDAVVLREGKQVTEFQEGILPWAMQRPIALILDEYDAGRPDVMFVLQRVLEADGKLTLLERNLVLDPHERFRLFATANTIGRGNTTGAYAGAQRMNFAQLDRWNIVAKLGYLPAEEEIAIVRSRARHLSSPEGYEVAKKMVAVAELTRNAFAAGDLSTPMSPRTVLSWAENLRFFGNLANAFRMTYLDRCDPMERELVAELFQRCTDSELAIDG